MVKQFEITAKKEENLSKWYTQVIQKSDLMDYSEVSGCMIFKPLAYAIWETIRDEVDKRFKEIGIQNVYFPLFIPESLLEREAEHFEGFSPEVAWVTHAGDSKLGERLAIRPTSEAIMYPTFSKWIKSWRDLPLLLNQWNNVVRWEFKDPTPFLRTREFLWNEGHNAYRNKEGALEDRDKVLNAYKEVTEEILALPGIMGEKSKKEKFAGAISTYTIEHLMPDGKGLQGPDYHYDGTNFAKAFDITFLDEEGKHQYVHQTTYATTTREIGAMILTHSDNRGLVLPPRIAPIKTVIIPIYTKEEAEEVLTKAKQIHSRLEESKLDDRETYSAGWKFSEWEAKGVPIRIEIGPKEVKTGEITLVRRDTGETITVKESKLEEKVENLLEEIQEHLYERAKKFLKRNIRETNELKQARSIIEEKGGFVKIPFCGEVACEEKINDETGAKISNIPFKYGTPSEKCIACGKDAKHYAHIAKVY